VSAAPETLHKLIEQAEEVLADNDLGSDSIIPKVEAYIEAFQSWSQSGIEARTEDNAELMRLQDLHARVIRCVSTLQAGTAGELRNLKRRARGLMAYTDLLPKQIGVVRKKG
jgi:hypothetical protein